MPNEPPRIEIITATSAVGAIGDDAAEYDRLCGRSPAWRLPDLLFKWRQLMSEGGRTAVKADEDVVGSSRLRELEARVGDLEWLLGRKTLEVEVLKEALAMARGKKSSWQVPSPPPGGSR